MGQHHPAWALQGEKRGRSDWMTRLGAPKERRPASPSPEAGLIGLLSSWGFSPVKLALGQPLFFVPQYDHGYLLIQVFMVVLVPEYATAMPIPRRMAGYGATD